MYIIDKCVFCDVDMIYIESEELYECPLCASIAYDNEDKNDK